MSRETVSLHYNQEKVTARYEPEFDQVTLENGLLRYKCKFCGGLYDSPGSHRINCQVRRKMIRALNIRTLGQPLLRKHQRHSLGVNLQVKLLSSTQGRAELAPYPLVVEVRLSREDLGNLLLHPNGLSATHNALIVNVWIEEISLGVYASITRSSG